MRVNAALAARTMKRVSLKVTMGRDHRYVLRAAASPPISCQRILPTQTGKASEVAIGRTEDESVLDRERRQMRVGDQVRPAAVLAQDRTEHLAVAIGWQR